MRERIYVPIKRIIDVVVASLLAVLLAPVAIAVAILVRARLGSPVFFTQQRPGLNAEPFTMIKFRTLRTGDAPDDERLTSLGAVLRSLSLDELPELWNVLRGDMSLVGPRPLLMDYLDFYTDEQARRHDVRPGLTGLAQIEGRNELDWPTRLSYDVRYVDNCSLGLDLSILARTLRTIVKREGTTGSGRLVGTVRFDDWVQQTKSGERSTMGEYTI